MGKVPVPGFRGSYVERLHYRSSASARNKEPENQKLLSDSYNEIGKELGAIVVPVGVAWQKLLAKHDKPILHAQDGSHPTVAGSYLAACTFYATLFGGDPTELEADVDELTDDERKLLQRIAKVACKK